VAAVIVQDAVASPVARRQHVPPVFWRLTIIMTLNRLGLFVAPFLTYYLARGLHLGGGPIAAIVTAFGAGWAIGPPLAGHIADRLGRKTVITASQLAVAVVYYAAGHARGLPHLVAAAFAIGILYDDWRAPATAIVYDACASAEQQQRAMTRMFWALNLGLIASSVGAGVLAVTVGWQWLFTGNALSAAGFAVAAWIALPASRPGRPAERARIALADPYLAWFTLLTLVTTTVYSQVWYGLPLRFAGAGISPLAYGALVAANPLIIAVGQAIPAVQRKIETMDPVWACTAGIALIGAGVALTGIGRGLTWFLAMSAVWTAGEALFFGPGQVLAARLSPPGRAGGYLGSWGGALGLSMLAASASGSWLIRLGGLHLLWAACAVASAAAAAGCMALLVSPEARARLTPPGIAPGTGPEAANASPGPGPALDDLAMTLLEGKEVLPQ
jgi:predicted MFS family arabinose efflux permease